MQETISGYTITEELGKGPLATVYKAFHQDDPVRPLTLKIFKKSSLPDSLNKYFRLKIEQLKVLHDHRLILPLVFGEEGDVLFIVQEFFDGVPLNDWYRQHAPIPLPIFFQLACRFAEILDSIQQSGIIHGGVKPHNLLIHPDWDCLDIRLIDFLTPLDVRDVSHFIYARGFVEGTLPYSSPEQTGRINYRVDFTTDLYSLGIIYYELLTGTPPFFSSDPLELIHSHLAEEAPSIHLLKKEIPSVLSSIIAKLIQKQPEKRYQSGSGLLADLKRCQDEYQATSVITDFPLGRHDHTRRVAFISRMVGRDQEAGIILAEYNKVMTGLFRSLLISGLPGIGKTRLIQELQKPIIEHRGYFTSGKFDVYQKNIPYSSLIQAIRNLMRTLLTESDDRLGLWKRKIAEAVGAHGMVVTDVLPELKVLIGPQPEVNPLPPVESRNRFLDVFGRFLSCLADQHNPLVLFIDDLQWCDIASFDLLADLYANHHEHPYLFLLGAYRHNEVDAGHPLTKLIHDIKNHGHPLKEIRLMPLKAGPCHEMVSYILDTPPSETEALARFITELTEGNPLFVSEFLSYLYNENLLVRDKEGPWRWSLEKIRQSDMPSNVVKLFSSKVRKLPSSTINMLEYSACMGNLFSPDEIASVCENSLQETFEALKPAMRQGLVVENKSELQFVHDRVQEAVLREIDPARRQRIHWQIGNQLLTAVPKDTDLENLDTLFTICSHLNLGTEQPLERKIAERLSDINYHAGNKALRSLATEAANEYFRNSLKLLSADCWQTGYGRAFEVYRKAAKTELMCGRYESSETLINELLSHAVSDLDRAEALAEQTASLSSIGNFIKAVETANRGLAIFNKSVPMDSKPAEQRREQLMAEISSAGTNIWDTILNMQFTEDRKSKIELAFYSELIPDLYMSGLVPQLYLSAVQSTKYCLEGGMDESVIYSFSIMGLYKGEQGEFEEAFLYEDLACNLAEKYPNTFGATRGMNGVVWCNMHSRSHPEEVVRYCLKSIQCGKNCGDLYNAGLSYGPLMWNLQVQGADMLSIEKYARECLQFSEKYHLSFSVGLARAMQAGWIAPMHKDYSPIPMEETIKKWKKENHIASAGSYHVHMALSLYYFGEYEKADHHLKQVERYLHGLTDNVLKRQWHVFLVLNALRLYGMRERFNREEDLFAFIQPHIDKIETWARFGPLLRPYLAFIRAELARVTGEFKTARNLYLDGVALADELGYSFLEGHLNECLGELLLDAGQGTAGIYLAEAGRLYMKCHADRKELTLRGKYPDHFKEQAPVFSPGEMNHVTEHPFPSLDVNYLMKSSLAISAEMDSEILLKKIMNVVLEASGAQHGYLLVNENGDLLVRAGSHITEKKNISPVTCPLAEAKDICKAIVRFVYRTRTRLILNNAEKEGEFKDNPEVRAMGLKSVLCLPLIKQTRLTGILYLENRLADSVFTPEKAEMTELLTSQAAISLENSRLMQEMREAKGRIKESLLEKEVLLKEVHHRVKNNLQVVCSLLNLQVSKIPDKQGVEMLVESQNRIRSMALIHEKLYQAPDLAQINFSEYIKSLVIYLYRSYTIDSAAITIDISVENVFLPIDLAIPCGLIVNELVSNCLKYAFPGGRHGRVTVKFIQKDTPAGKAGQQGKGYVLHVSDDGVGFPKDFDLSGEETLGLQLVKMLTKELDGDITYNSSIRAGTAITITFPEPGSN